MRERETEKSNGNALRSVWVGKENVSKILKVMVRIERSNKRNGSVVIPTLACCQVTNKNKTEADRVLCAF